MGERHDKRPQTTLTVFLLTYPDFSLCLVSHFFLDGDPEQRSSEVDVVVEIKGVGKAAKHETLVSDSLAIP